MFFSSVVHYIQFAINTYKYFNSDKSNSDDDDHDPEVLQGYTYRLTYTRGLMESEVQLIKSTLYILVHLNKSGHSNLNWQRKMYKAELVLKAHRVNCNLNSFL